MKRRALLSLMTGGAATGLAAAGGTLTFRLHKDPRQKPFLTDDHLEGVSEAHRILFVGNSIVLNHDVPARITALAEQEGVQLNTATAAANGARLIETIRLESLNHILQPGLWDVVVLQDFTKTPLRAFDRWGSRYAMKQISRSVGTIPVLLFPPWPAAETNHVYQDPGFMVQAPADPEDYAARSMAFYTSIAQDHGFHVAPVPLAWLKATHDGAPLYHQDTLHASEAGADFAAAQLWAALKPLLP